jgi:hypothetical protein
MILFSCICYISPSDWMIANVEFIGEKKRERRRPWPILRYFNYMSERNKGNQ